MNVIEYDGNKTIVELKSEIDSCHGTPIAELRILELAKHGSGIYIFYEMTDNKREYIYVGKATSQSLAQRIAIHFDTRDDPKVAFMSGIVRKVWKTLQAGLQQPPLIDAIAHMEKMGTSLILITFRDHKECARIARSLEKFLIDELKEQNTKLPKYNWRGGEAALPRDSPLKELIPI